MKCLSFIINDLNWFEDSKTSDPFSSGKTDGNGIDCFANQQESWYWIADIRTVGGAINLLVIAKL